MCKTGAATVAKLMQPLTAAAWSDLRASVDSIVFDADGVLWKGGHVLPGAVDLVRRLVDDGKEVYMATNNSTRTAAAHLDKCRKFGLDFKLENIVCTSAITADYVHTELPHVRKVFVIGEASVTEDLRRRQIDCITCDVVDARANLNSPFLHDTDIARHMQPEVDCVVVAYDGLFSYFKLALAASYLNRRGCAFVATNTDAHFPGQDQGVVIPGTGSIVSAVSTAAGRQPIIMGKPCTTMAKYLQKVHTANKGAFRPGNMLMIGDNLSTDIRWARDCGMRSLCVLTGVTGQATIDALPEGDASAPEFVAPGLDALLAHF